MKNNYQLHHLGIATRSIEKCASVYYKLGYDVSEIIIEPSQNVKICFLSKTGSISIELVEPLNDNAPNSRIVKQFGTTPYHTCYEVSDIYQSVKELEEMNFRLLFEPTISEAMGKGLFCYLFSPEIGLFELYQQQK